ncbi:MAG: LuxR C-terminal-related transcriptional regulator [Pseudomonadota bacterium]
MPEATLNVIILSQHKLARELLGEILRIRCGARVIALLGSFELAARQQPAASVLVCDVSGLSAVTSRACLERLRADRADLRVVTVDDSLDGFSVEDLIASVRGLHARVQVPHERLTPLETEVMLAVAAGHRNADIARRMRRSSKTIEKHRANLLRKLGVRTVAQLTAYAIHNGLLRADAILQARRPS